MTVSLYPAHVVATSREFCVRSSLRRDGHAVMRPAVPNTELCGVCHARFMRELEDMIGYWPVLLEARVRRPTKDYSRDRVGGGEMSDAGAMWNPAATLAIVEVTDWAGYLVRTILRDRKFYDGEPIGFRDDESTPINVTLAIISRYHSRWLTHYPTIGAALLEDAIRLNGRCMSALDQPAVQRVTMKNVYCRHIVFEDEASIDRCGAPMAGIIPTDKHSTLDAELICTVNPGHARLKTADWILHSG